MSRSGFTTAAVQLPAISTREAPRASARGSHEPRRLSDSLVDTGAQSRWKLGYRLSLFPTFVWRFTRPPLGGVAPGAEVGTGTEAAGINYEKKR